MPDDDYCNDCGTRHAPDDAEACIEGHGDDPETDGERCNGQCTPDLALYHARCPLHGVPLWRLVLETEASNAAQRAEDGDTHD